ARKFLDQIGIDRARAEQTDAVLQADPRGTDLRKLLLMDAKFRARARQRDGAAFTPDRVVAEIGNDGGTDGWADGSSKKAGHTAPNSHAPNESHTDSPGQEVYR